MTDILRVCVFGSSRTTTPKKYLDAAQELGEMIAERKYICVNGGGGFGVMGK